MNFHQLAALYVGKAIQLVFSKEHYFGSEVGENGFSCSFSYSGKFDQSLLELIERSITEHPIQELEMLASNAGELFAHLGLQKMAEKARKLDGVVHVAKFENFADFYEGDLGEFEAVALLGFEQDRNRVQIYGKGFESKPERKAFLKKYTGYRGAAYWGRELELFEGDKWLPRGKILIQSMLEYLEERARQSVQELGIEARLEDGELRIKDQLGIERSGPYVEVGDVESLVHALLEQTEGELPFSVAPEQIRVIPMDGADPKDVIKLLKRNGIRYSIDTSSASLREKTERALHIKVPYVIFFGKREEAAKSITIRACGSKNDDAMTYEKFETFVQERK